MATVPQGDIQLGGNRIVGKVRIDPGLIRGEGGPHDPVLVIPLNVELHPRPAEEMIALLRLSAVLHDGAVNMPNTRLGTPATLDLMENMNLRSVPSSPTSHSIDLRFSLNPAGVDRLERARQRTAPGSQFLHITFAPTFAWLERTYGQGPGNFTPDPLQMHFGLHSVLSVFWNSRIDTLSVGIDPSVWISSVVPGLGADRVRLVEVPLPPATPSSTASKKWDEAETAYHQQQYDLCVGHCRGLIRAWNHKLGASKERHLAQIVGDRNHWADDDPRRKLLDSVWQGLLDMANAPLHEEDNDTALGATAADAKFHQLMTAVVSDYVAKIAPS